MSHDRLLTKPYSHSGCLSSGGYKTNHSNHTIPFKEVYAELDAHVRLTLYILKKGAGGYTIRYTIRYTIGYAHASLARRRSA